MNGPADPRPMRPWNVHGLAFLLMIALIVLSLYLSTGVPLVFFDPASAVIVGGLTLLALFVTHRPAEVLEAVTRAVAGAPDPEGRSFGILAAGRAYAIAFGALGFFIGIIAMLAELDTPSQVGRGLSVALITVFYGIVLSEAVLHPLALRLVASPPRAAELHPFAQAHLGLVFGGLLAVLIVLVPLGLDLTREAPEDLVGAIEGRLAPGADPVPWLVQGGPGCDVRRYEGRIEILGRGEWFAPSGEILPEAEPALLALASAVRGYTDRLEILVPSGPGEAAAFARGRALRDRLRDPGGIDPGRLEIRVVASEADPGVPFRIRVGRD